MYLSKKHISFIVILLIAIIAIFTNPNEERHKKAIKNNFNAEFFQEMLDSAKHTKNLRASNDMAFAMIFGGAITGLFIDNIITVDNYLLFSVSKIKWKEKSKFVGVGAFGNVFLIQKMN